MTRLPIVLALALAAPGVRAQTTPAASISAKTGPEAGYDAALRELKAAEDAYLQASGDYEKTRAEKRLASARDGVSQARRDLADAGLPVPAAPAGVTSPADEAFKVPDIGPSGALDPNVHQGSWVGEPKAPRTPVARPTVPGGVEAVQAMDGSRPGEVGYEKPQGSGAAAEAKGAAGGRMVMQRPKPEPAEGPIESSPVEPAKIVSGPVEPKIQGGYEGLPARKGVDFLKEALPWKPLPQPKTSDQADEDMKRAELVSQARRSLRGGDASVALAQVEELLRLSPKDGAIRHLKAMILNQLGRYSDAAREAEESLRLGYSEASVYETLAWAQLHLGLYEAAAASASAAIRLRPDASLAYAVRAHALDRLGRGPAGIADIVRAASLRPATFGAMAAQAKASGTVSTGAATAGSPSPALGKRWVLAALLALAALGAGFTVLVRRY